jgi:hypothetical protein
MVRGPAAIACAGATAVSAAPARATAAMLPDILTNERMKFPL